MAVLKSVVCVISCKAAALLLLLAVAAVQSQTAKAQPSCPDQLTNLNVCAPYVVPGTTETTPNPQCCGALRAVQPDCLCNTLRIASRLPSRCNLPVLNCGVQINA